uniref:F-box domain-containing protein n=1 Tax=Strongyloides stercoralis TaxID=6248 RepID=A0A0K0E6F1_STRER
MENGKGVSFINLMGINLIRKNIFEKIPSVKDISSLSKTCRLMYFYVRSSKFSKETMWFKDLQTIKIKPNNENIGNLKPLKLKDIVFENDGNIFKVSEGAKCFFGETVPFWNCITFNICNYVMKFKKRDCDSIIKKLVKEMDINCSLRKDARILNFLIRSNNNHHMILHALSYMKHDNIVTIVLPATIFMSDSFHDNQLENNIFKGFPNLCEISIVTALNVNNYNDSKINENIIDIVLKEFSKKKNAKILLSDSDFAYENSPILIDIILKVAAKYQIKFTCNGYYLFNKINQFVCPVEEGNLKIGELLTDVSLSFSSSITFPETMKKLQSHVNFEKLKLQFHFFNIQEILNKLNKINYGSISLKNCINLKDVQFIFSDYSIIFNSYDKYEMIRQISLQNIKCLATLMPNNVEKLELWYIYGMTQELAGVLNKYMPKIKILKTYKVTSNDCDWLKAFKNLQVYIYYGNNLIEVPSTVKVLNIRNSDIYGNGNEECIGKEVINNYSAKFSKCIKNGSNDYIFFNNLEDWERFNLSVYEF